MSESTINGVRVPFLPVGGVDGLRDKPPIDLPKDRSFEAILEKELAGVKFSKHAQERLESRNINLSEADVSSINKAVSLAAEKGSQDSLVFLRDMAFVVSVRNKTVVTAMQGENLRENVFTKIDSAVVAG